MWPFLLDVWKNPNCQQETTYPLSFLKFSVWLFDLRTRTLSVQLSRVDLPKQLFLDVSACNRVENLDFLRGCPRLQVLKVRFLWRSSALPSLPRFVLMNCRSLSQVDASQVHIAACLNLKTLIVGPKTTYLFVDECSNLANIIGLTPSRRLNLE